MDQTQTPPTPPPPPRAVIILRHAQAEALVFELMDASGDSYFVPIVEATLFESGIIFARNQWGGEYSTHITKANIVWSSGNPPAQGDGTDAPVIPFRGKPPREPA